MAITPASHYSTGAYAHVSAKEGNPLVASRFYKNKKPNPLQDYIQF